MTTKNDLNISVNFHSNKTLVDALFEIIANALDANAAFATDTDIEYFLNDKKLVIENNSKEGILLKNFVIGGSGSSIRSPPAVQKIGQHGLGLKDAISILYRLNHTVEIESRNVVYRFTVEMSDLNEKTLHVEKSDVMEDIGKVRVNIYNIEQWIMNNDVKKAKEKFMCFRKSALSIELHSSSNVDVYQTPDKIRVGYIYVNGVMKNVNFKNLSFIYNFKGVSMKDRGLIDSNHNITDLKKTEMYKILRDLIDSPAISIDAFLPNSYECQLKNKPIFIPTLIVAPVAHAVPKPLINTTMQVVHSPTPSAPATILPPVVPSQQPLNKAFENSFIDLLVYCLNKQDAALYTLTYDIEKITAELKTAIQQMKSISVEKIENSGGAFAKHTAVPGYADVELFVFLNNFDVHNCNDGVYRERFHRELTSKGVQFILGAPDFLTCKYKEVDFDIVFTSSSRPHPRYQSFTRSSQSVDDLISIIGDKDSWVYEVIRACKYWIQRHMYAAIKRVKSYAIELIVMHEYVGGQRVLQNHAPSGKRYSLFLKFLQFLANANNNNSRGTVTNLTKEKQDIFNEQDEWRQTALTEFANYSCQHLLLPKINFFA